MRIYLDFETYFDKDYSLRKMSMEEYINDPRFEAYMLSVAVNDEPVRVYTGYDVHKVVAALPLDRPNVYTWAQHARFDTFILETRFKKEVKNPICLRSQARWCGVSRLSRESLDALAMFFGLPPKGEALHNMCGVRWGELALYKRGAMIEYCRQDTYLLREIERRMRDKCSQEVLDFIAMSVKAYTQPKIQIDVSLLEEYVVSLEQKQEQAKEEIMQFFAFKSMDEFMKTIRSPVKFPAMLASLGVEVPMKVSENKTKTARKKAEAAGIDPGSIAEQMSYALSKDDPDFLALLDHEDERVRLLVQIRLEHNSSIAKTRAETFINIGRRSALPVTIEAYQAHTGRFSGASHVENSRSDRTNMQNLSKRKGDKTLRRSLVAPEGCVFVEGDSGQVEARVGAYIACQFDLLEGFRNNEDVYCDLASAFFNLPALEIEQRAKIEKDKAAITMRNAGKTGVLSGQYGVGPEKFARKLWTDNVKLAETRAEHNAIAARIHGVLAAKYPALKQFRNTCQRVVEALERGERGTFGGHENRLFQFHSDIDIFGRPTPGIILPNGYPILYPNLRVIGEGQYGPQYGYDKLFAGRVETNYIYGGLLFNNICQGSASGMLAWQAGHIDKMFPICLNIHDSFCSIVAQEYVEIAVECYKTWLTTPPDYFSMVPLSCEVETGKRYGEME